MISRIHNGRCRRVSSSNRMKHRRASDALCAASGSIAGSAMAFVHSCRLSGLDRTGSISDVGGRFGSAVVDGALERDVVAFVLVGVDFREVGDRMVEGARAAEVGGQGDAIAGTSVSAGQ